MSRPDQPQTVTSLIDDLNKLGVRPGQILLVHCAFSKLGTVYGGPQALIDALQQCLTPSGTLVMPTHSTQLTEPSRWEAPPAPAAAWPQIRQELPAYDTARTMTRAMGALAELFRTYPGVIRSAHPHGSFAAWGAHADTITAEHALNSIFGEQSPLAKLYERDAQVLLIGVDHGNNTSLHLAEYRSSVPNKPYHTEGAPMIKDGTKQWVEFNELVIDSDDFAALGLDFEQQTDAQTRGQIANAEALFFPQVRAVDFAVDWFNQHRGQQDQQDSP